MSEERKYKFAKTKLVHQARTYWDKFERMIRLQVEIPITTWRAMKSKLREMYLPVPYHQGSYEPKLYEPRSITYRSKPISYEPKEPITPRYQSSASQVLLSWPEPIRISAPYQKLGSSQIHSSRTIPQ